MDFVFLMMKKGVILSVDILDIEKEEMTIEQAAEKLLGEAAQKGEQPTAYAVLGCSDNVIWLLQQTKRVGGKA